MVIGFVSIGLIFIAEHMGTLFELAASFLSVLSGPTLGLFVLGMILPWAGKKGALVGGYASLVVMIWIAWGAKWHVMNGRVRYQHLPVSMDGCPLNGTDMTMTTTMLPPIADEDLPWGIFRISILHYGTIGTLITVVVGLVVSYLTKETDLDNVNPDYISPVMHRLANLFFHEFVYVH